MIERRGVRVIGISTGSPSYFLLTPPLLSVCHSLHTGTLGAFKFQVLLLQLTTSLALIKLASVIVDTLAVRFLPRKKLYKYVFWR